MSETPYVIELQTRAPERDGMNELLSEYYALMIERLEGMGGGGAEGGKKALAEFWNEIDLFLPPRGRLYLARNDDGDLIGCGSLKDIGGGKGELKRLFVRPSARGTGLGKALVELRVEAAREMGLKELLVDTFKANVEMRGLYAKLGFAEIELYPESATYKMAPKLMPYMCFFRLEL